MTRTLPVLALPCTALFGLLAVASAQAPAVWPMAVGVTFVDGQIQAMGPGYRARFDDGGMEFTPALGPRADTTCLLRYELDSVHRGGLCCELGSRAVAQPRPEGTRVLRRHDNDVAEVYEARPEGLEQMFVFERRPAGHGDLVVRGRIATGLPLASVDPHHGLRFEAAGVGGVAIGSVTGVDANGARMAGTVRYDGTHVEFVLPAAFVDGAAYPLTLDPLVGAAFPIGNLPGLDSLPSVAFDVSTQRYLVAWAVELSSQSSELRGQLLQADGTPIGSAMLLANSASVTEPSAVVNVNSRDRFLVVYRTKTVQGTNVHCLAVTAATGAVTVSVPLGIGSSGYDYQFAAGGDSRAGGDRVLVVYTDYVPNMDRVRFLQVTVPSVGLPVVGTPLTLATSPNGTFRFGDVAVSRSGGSNGRWLACYRQFKDLQCVAISEIGTLCSPITTVYSASTFDGITNLGCATMDGNSFAIAWGQTSLLTTPRLRLRPVNLLGICPASVSFGTTVTAIADTGGTGLFALDFARDKYVLAWNQFGTSAQVLVRGLDPATCADCGADHAVEPSVPTQSQPAFASRWSSGDTGSDEGLLAWTDSTIRGRLFAARGTGLVATVGGACGVAGGGSNVPGHLGAPVIGDQTFALSLGAPTAPVLAAIVGLSQAALPCGPCVLVPNLDIVMAGAGPHPIPLPCDLSYLGVPFWAQWLLFAPGGCSILPDFALSDAQQFTIGE